MIGILIICFVPCIFSPQIGSFWIQSVYERGRHAGESYNPSESWSCKERKTGVREDEGEHRRLWRSPGPNYRSDVFMNWCNTWSYCCIVGLFNIACKDECALTVSGMLQCSFFQSHQPFPGVWTAIFSKHTTWFPPRTTLLHRNHELDRHQQVPDLPFTHSELFMNDVFSPHCFPCASPVSKIESCQAHYRLHHARDQGASGWWFYKDSQSSKGCIKNERVRPQLDFWVQLGWPKEEEHSQEGKEYGADMLSLSESLHGRYLKNPEMKTMKEIDKHRQKNIQS